MDRAGLTEGQRRNARGTGHDYQRDRARLPEGQDRTDIGTGQD